MADKQSQVINTSGSRPPLDQDYADTFYELFGGPSREFLIGPEKRSLYLPEAALKQSSHYFAAMLDGNFSEPLSKKPIPLPEDDFEAYMFFSFWLVRGRFPRLRAWRTGRTKLETLRTELKTLCELWLLADKIGSMDLANITMSKLCPMLENYMINSQSSIKETAKTLPVSLFTSILKRTPAYTFLYKLLTATVAMNVQHCGHAMSDYADCFTDEDFVCGVTGTLKENMNLSQVYNKSLYMKSDNEGDLFEQKVLDRLDGKS
ncbi:MAG: hypothetical protein M1820_005886 [Bogoriella megaspora]|nr:MAG: hypothetical protein M1820_005886 [Bogoriella megaspora]